MDNGFLKAALANPNDVSRLVYADEVSSPHRGVG
jgi:hypothetical protein